MASPSARPTPNTIAAKIPDLAAGITTFMIVCIRVAPSAYDEARSDVGTERSADTLIPIMVGSTIIASTHTHASILEPPEY